MASMSNELRAQSSEPDTPAIKSQPFPAGPMENSCHCPMYNCKCSSQCSVGSAAWLGRVCETGIQILSLEGGCRGGDKGSAPVPGIL